MFLPEDVVLCRDGHFLSFPRGVKVVRIACYELLRKLMLNRKDRKPILTGGLDGCSGHPGPPKTMPSASCSGLRNESLQMQLISAEDNYLRQEKEPGAPSTLSSGHDAEPGVGR